MNYCQHTITVSTKIIYDGLNSDSINSVSRDWSPTRNLTWKSL